MEDNLPRELTSPVLRRGKWTAEEERYTEKIIANFENGTLDVPEGTTLRCFLSKVLNCDPMRITKKYTGNSSIGKRTFMPLMRSAENVAFIDSSRAELALLRTIWINKLFLTEKNGSRKAAKASLSPADKAAAHPRGLPAKQQRQHPSLSPSTSPIDLEQWNRLIASGDLSNPLLQQLLASASASMMKPSSSPFESQEDSTADAEGDADDNDSADGASLSLSSSTTSDSPSLSLMSTVHRLKPKVSGSRHSEPLVSYGRLFTPVGPQASSSSSSSVHDAKSLAVLPPRVLAQMSPTDFSHYQAQLQQFRLEQAVESSSAAVRLSGSKRPVDEDAEDEEGEATKYRRFDAEDSLNGPNDTLESAALALLGLCQR